MVFLHVQFFTYFGLKILRFFMQQIISWYIHFFVIFEYDKKAHLYCLSLIYYYILSLRLSVIVNRIRYLEHFKQRGIRYVSLIKVFKKDFLPITRSPWRIFFWLRFLFFTLLTQIFPRHKIYHFYSFENYLWSPAAKIG